MAGTAVDMGNSAPAGMMDGSCCEESAGLGTIWAGEAGEEDSEIDTDDESTILLCVTSGMNGDGACKI